MKGENLDWPKERQAYVTLFGGFLLMFNSWGIVNVGILGATSVQYIADNFTGLRYIQLVLPPAAIVWQRRSTS